MRMGLMRGRRQKGQKSRRKMSEKGRRRGRRVKNETDCASRYPEWQAGNEGSIKAPLQGQSKEEKKVCGLFLLSLLSRSANTSVSVFMLSPTPFSDAPFPSSKLRQNHP